MDAEVTAPNLHEPFLYTLCKHFLAKLQSFPRCVALLAPMQSSLLMTAV